MLAAVVHPGQHETYARVCAYKLVAIAVVCAPLEVECTEDVGSVSIARGTHLQEALTC
jgi:hypothetical protein